MLFQELLQKLIQQRHELRQRDAHIADLERYIDELLVKVIDLQPLLLSHDVGIPPTPRPPTLQPASQPGNSEARSNPATPARHTSPFIRQAVPQRSSSSLKKFVVGPLQTLLKWRVTNCVFFDFIQLFFNTTTTLSPSLYWCLLWLYLSRLRYFCCVYLMDSCVLIWTINKMFANK